MEQDERDKKTKSFRIMSMVAIGLLALMVVLVNVRVTQINDAMYVINDNVNNVNENLIEVDERLENDHVIIYEFVNETCGEEI